MSVMNSWCERSFLCLLLISILIITADCKFYFLPVNGLWLILYVLFVIILSIWIICVVIQKLLKQNNPFEYNIDNNKYVKKLKRQLFGTCSTNEKVSKISNDSDDLKKDQPIDERIDLLVNDIEQRFISKWYNLISNEDTFPAESKILLEGIVRRFLQISVQMDSNKLVCGALIILLKHLKEYRKAEKRVKKNGGSIENVYRYSHLGNKSETAVEHFNHRLTANVLREFISWELWNSLPCRLLVSILSKRLTSYIIYYVSQPGWLNYKILYQLASKSDIDNLKLDDYLYISLSDVDLSDRIIEFNLNTEELKVKTRKLHERSDSCTPKMSPKRDIIDPLLPTPNNEQKSSTIDSIIKSDSESVIEQALTKMITHQTAPILQRATNNDITSNDNEELSNETVMDSLQTPFQLKRSEPVKIHSAKSTSKRWDDTCELSNVSLGQDLLALEVLETGSGLLQGFSGRRLWGYNADTNEVENDKSWDVVESWPKELVENNIRGDDVSPMQAGKSKRKDTSSSASPPPSLQSAAAASAQNLVQCLRPNTTSATAFVTNTIKPIAGNVTATTLHNMRELQQSTVHATEKAMHRIGDLQDEAVGVVEGIFDFGMAGLRKGLRLTGLQDNNNDTITTNIKNTKVQSPKTVPKLMKLGHVTSTIDESKLLVLPVAKTNMVAVPNTVENTVDTVWINPLAKDSPNGFENQMLLEKSPNPIDNESSSEPQSQEIPGIFQSDSPEYEETADLASTISKLRSLLQQKSESNLNTPAVSPMPLDDKNLVTSEQLVTTVSTIDGTNRSIVTTMTTKSTTEADGGMQRFARTVTGMFNTFKTALPGNVPEQLHNKTEQWIFVENEPSDTDLPSLLNSLLVERRDYCTVDTAYEAMDSLDLLTESVNSQITKISWDNQLYEDELDDLDRSIPKTKALFDIICECMQDTVCSINQEPIMKALLIITGSKTEKQLDEYAEKLLGLINRSIGPLPKNLQDNVTAMKLEEFVSICEKSLPYYIRELFGHDDIKTGLKFFISSLQSPKINQDIMLQIFELICSQLIYASSQMSPTPSA